ncbi:MAG: hypothetical protein ABF633_07860 [Clostridium sp.]|uniref:hypothetical protein n=1 Tax=Clostridium sp. TaxID=1506 RepID=UPI0039E866A9
MGCKSSSDFLGLGRKNNKIIIIILIFVLFIGCGGSQGGGCCPDPCCRGRRRRSGFGGSSLIPIAIVLAIVFGLGNNRGGNTNIIKVNTDPSDVRGESTEFSSCDY